MVTKIINEHVTAGSQPNEQEIGELAHRGFQSVINLRRGGEGDQPLTPGDEAVVAHRAGLKYVHMPVTLEGLSVEQADHFRAEVKRLRGPVYVHCLGGTRAGTLAVLAEAIESGKSGEKALQMLEELGFQSESPNVKEFVKNYLDPQRAH
jgi:uncharacterized protein (TIGR01244 family)